MNTRALNVLHNTGDKDILSVADSVYLDLCTLKVLVDEDRVLYILREDDRHIFLNIGVVEGNDHILTAEHIGRTEQYGITDLVRYLKRFLGRHNGNTLRALDVVFFEQLVKTLSVLCHINGVIGCAEDLNAVVAHKLCELDSGLSAERDNYAVGLLCLDNAHYVLVCERFKVKSVGGIKVGGYRLGVVVYDNNVIARLFERPYG